MKYLFFLLFIFPAHTLFSQIADTSFSAQIARHRQEYKSHFLTELRSPLGEEDTALLDFYAPNPAWRVKAKFERAVDVKPFDMPTYSGRNASYQQYGRLIFEKGGKTDTLSIYQNLRLMNSQKHFDYLFLPFKDLTNGEATFGGGRYLDFRIGDISTDNILVIDFNKSYNPWCAFSEGYNCPIPPPENYLEMAVEAGEKNFRGEKKQ